MKPEPNRAAPANTGATVEYKVQFSTGAKGRKRLPAEPTATTVPTPTKPAAERATTQTPIAAIPTREAVPLARSAAPEATLVPAATAATRPIASAAPQAPTPASHPAPVPRVPKATLLLVLGHHFERLVRDGIVKDYADIGRRTGLTRARVCQIVNLTLLAPEIQEKILGLELTARGDDPVHDRSLRAVVAKSDWGTQRFLWPRRAI